MLVSTTEIMWHEVRSVIRWLWITDQEEYRSGYALQ